MKPVIRFFYVGILAMLGNGIAFMAGAFLLLRFEEGIWGLIPISFISYPVFLIFLVSVIAIGAIRIIKKLKPLQRLPGFLLVTFLLVFPPVMRNYLLTGMMNLAGFPYQGMSRHDEIMYGLVMGSMGLLASTIIAWILLIQDKPNKPAETADVTVTVIEAPQEDNTEEQISVVIPEEDEEEPEEDSDDGDEETEEVDDEEDEETEIVEIVLEEETP